MAVKGFGFNVIWTIICLLLLFLGSDGYKLNVPKLLLPYYSSVATNFTLEVSQGCFLWKSARPEIATVAGIGVKDPAQCSALASVSATSRVPSRKTAIVMAEDTVTGQQLRCDVIVDDIEKIEIVTTTKELYLDDTPEQFEIRAINEEGDVFSSLDGMEFEWNLLPDDVKDGQNSIPAHSVLRFLKFSESNYEAPDFIKDLEEKGRRGDRILMRGVRTGSARVSAKIADRVYEHVKEDVVKIVVVANIQLNPSIVYLLQYTTVTYKVELLKQGRIQEIPMPSQQYHLQVGNDKIASLDPETSTATALEYGDTEVKLKDKNIQMSGHKPSAAIYVVTPGYLEFDIYPGRSWVIQTNRVYEIIIHIYDKESHKIYPSSGIRVEALFPSEHFEVLSSSKNGTYHVVRTKQRGFTTLEGKLDAVVHVDGTVHKLTTAVEGTQEVEIYDPVTVVPKVVVIPWDPSASKHYQYQLTATGGSGNYTWVSEDSKIGTVSTRGLLVASKSVGHGTVTVSDVRNPAHFDTMEFYVLPPGELEFIPSKVEAELTSVLELPLAVYATFDGRRLKFNLCDFMPLTTLLKDNSIFKYIEVTKPSVKGSCASVKVEARHLGHTEVTTTYKYGDHKLTASIIIAAYKPLQAVDPEEVAVITVAASKEILFEGGPQPWVVDPSGYYEKVQMEKSEILKMASVKVYGTRKAYHAFHVTCLDLGEQEIKLDVGNTPTVKNQFPANCSATIRFVCAEPRGLHLLPLVPQPKGLPPCPLNMESDDPVPAHSYLPLDILVRVTDAEGRSFDNFSSLLIDWKLSDVELGRFSDESRLAATKMERVETWKRRARSYKTIETFGRTGLLTVTASITKYNLDYFGSRHFDLALGTPIKREKTINFVHDAIIKPDHLTLYNHGTDTAVLQLLHGSDHFHMDYSAGLVVVDPDRKTRDIHVKPSVEGTFTAVAYDLCLEVKSPAKATVVVSDVYQIQLTVVDKVELGSHITAYVQVRDHNGKPVPAKYFPVMNLRSKIGSELISVRLSPDKSDIDEFTSVYTVRGISLGHTTLQFEASQKSGKVVASYPKDIQVFPPLRLEPRNITLIVGAIFQVTAHGGPQPESTIEFSIVNDTVAKVSAGGVIETEELGVTRVIGRAVGVDVESGYVIYSQDEVTINVIQLQGIRIHAPLKRLQAGTEMPVYAVGLNENEGPFSFGNAIPPLSFHWSISNSDVAKLQPVFYKGGIQPTAENNIAVRFSASEAGRVTVHLEVTPDPSSRLQIKTFTQLEDSLQIQVFERLQVISPNVCDGVFIMTPNTEAQIKTNRDSSSAKLSYSVIDHGTLHHNQGPVIMVAEGGHVISYGHVGEASLWIKSQEDFGINQTIVVLVKVKPVSYLMLNSDTVIKTRGAPLTALPVGSTLHFVISFHDDIGESFYATNSKIKFRPNRYDLLQISYGSDNNTLLARATNVGQTVLKVWDQSVPQLSDYISITVDTAITPSDLQVTIGDIICFSSPVVAETGAPGSWISSSVAIHLDQSSGIGVATHVGKATISYMPSSLTTTHTYVTVTPVSHVTLKNEHLQFITNVMTKNKVGIIQVILEGLDDDSESNIHGSNCSEYIQSEEFALWRLPFHCEVTMTTSHPHITVDDVVKVVNAFDAQTGQYQCQLNQQSGSHDLIQAISMLDTSLQLRAVVTARDGQPEVSSSILSLPFIPAFYVHTSELQLSNFVPKTQLKISATERVLQDVKVTSSDETLIKVLAPEKTARADYLASYPVVLELTASLWSRSQLEATIDVGCIATGQHQTVNVKIKLHGEQGTQVQQEITWSHVLAMLTNNYQNILFTVFCIVATIFCMVIAYQAVIGQRYQAAANQSNVFMPSSPPQQLSPWASPQNVSHSPTRLWSVDNGPFEGSGIFKRSPVH